jgi:hypothetical protein
MKKIVKIRYNTNYPAKSDLKWRLLIDGLESLVDDIHIFCESKTTTDVIYDEQKNMITKYHISCEADSVEIIEVNNTKLALIK